MKKYCLTLVVCFLTSVTHAQIILEHTYDSVTYDFSGSLDGVFYPCRISESEIKYVHIDDYTITLYNLDHSVFKTMTVPLQILGDNEDVLFISTTLFDTDSTTVEYLVEGKDLSGTWGTHIFNENNTQVFTAPGYYLWQQIIVLGKSKLFPNVINTDQGSKLLLLNVNGGVRIWSLPGTYYSYSGTGDDDNLLEMDLGLPAPNPSATRIIIPINIPSEAINPQLIMISDSGTEVGRYILNPGQDSFTLDTAQFAPGMYLLTIIAENGRSKTRKVMIR